MTCTIVSFRYRLGRKSVRFFYRWVFTLLVYSIGIGLVALIPVVPDSINLGNKFVSAILFFAIVDLSKISFLNIVTSTKL